MEIARKRRLGGRTWIGLAAIAWASAVLLQTSPTAAQQAYPQGAIPEAAAPEPMLPESSGPEQVAPRPPRSVTPEPSPLMEPQVSPLMEPQPSQRVAPQPLHRVAPLPLHSATPQRSQPVTSQTTQTAPPQSSAPQAPAAGPVRADGRKPRRFLDLWPASPISRRTATARRAGTRGRLARIRAGVVLRNLRWRQRAAPLLLCRERSFRPHPQPALSDPGDHSGTRPRQFFPAAYAYAIGGQAVLRFLRRGFGRHDGNDRPLPGTRRKQSR